MTQQRLPTNIPHIMLFVYNQYTRMYGMSSFASYLLLTEDLFTDETMSFTDTVKWQSLLKKWINLGVSNHLWIKFNIPRGILLLLSALQNPETNSADCELILPILPATRKEDEIEITLGILHSVNLYPFLRSTTSMFGSWFPLSVLMKTHMIKRSSSVSVAYLHPPVQ